MNYSNHTLKAHSRKSQIIEKIQLLTAFFTLIYAKSRLVELAQWCTGLLNHAESCSFIYNLTSKSCVDIPLEVIQNIQLHQNCWVMKEASSDLNVFLAFAKECPEPNLNQCTYPH
jgi:dihydrodipicolinate synthase/N-acetylneuraminate lyase